MKFPKSARIHHRSLQEQLFQKGHNLNEYPVRMIWRCVTHEELKANFRDSVPDLIGRVQVLVSVPKKMRKRAVDRVRMRRLLREAFRLGRAPLYAKLDEIPEVRTLSVGLVYKKQENIDYADVKERIDRLVAKLISRLDAKYCLKNETSEEETTDEHTKQIDGDVDENAS